MREDLTDLTQHTDHLLATAEDLDDVRAASLCEGWTRAHVLTHVARNAEAIGRLCTWAVTGTREPMYPGGTSARDAAIEAGSSRSRPELVEDLRRTAGDLVPQLAALAGPRAVQEVEMRGGLLVSADRLPFLRLREVVYHHVDLDAGFTFADVAPGLQRRFVTDAVNRLAADERHPPLVLRADDGGEWSTDPSAESSASPQVSGSLAGILLWLTRRDPRGVRANGPLPALPRGA